MIKLREVVAGTVIACIVAAPAGASAQAPPAAPSAPAPPAPYPAPVAPAPYPPPAVYPVPYPPPYYYPPAQGPRYIKDWQPGQPIPPGYREEARARRGLVIAGAVVFGALYLYTLIVADENDSLSGGTDSSWLWIPVIGPFIQAATSDTSIPDGILYLDGLGQASGLAMLITGLAFPKTILVRNDLAAMTVVPMKFGADGSGLGVVGRF